MILNSKKVLKVLICNVKHNLYDEKDILYQNTEQSENVLLDNK